MEFDLVYIPSAILFLYSFAIALSSSPLLSAKKVMISVLSVALASSFLTNGVNTLLQSLAILFYLLQLIFLTENLSEKKEYYFLQTLFWGILLIVANNMHIYLLALFAFSFQVSLNTLFQKKTNRSLKKNIVFYYISFVVIGLFLVTHILPEDLFSVEKTSKLIGPILLTISLVVMGFLSCFVMNNKTKKDLMYLVSAIVLLFLAVLKLSIQFKIFNQVAFEGPYLLNYSRWLILLFPLVISGIFYIYGSYLYKLFSFILLVLFQSLNLYANKPEDEVILFSYVLVSLLAVNMFFKAVEKKPSDMEGIEDNTSAIILITSMFLLISPLNFSLNQMLTNLFSISNLWEVRFEIAYFPSFLSLVPLLFAGYYAVVLSNDMVKDLRLSLLQKIKIVNFTSLCWLPMIVLGIYPFPLYIYMQLLLN